MVGPDTPFAEVMRVLEHRRLGAAMVADRGELYGIFTSHDACRLVAEVLDAPVSAIT